MTPQPRYSADEFRDLAELVGKTSEIAPLRQHLTDFLRYGSELVAAYFDPKRELAVMPLFDRAEKVGRVGLSLAGRQAQLSTQEALQVVSVLLRATIQADADELLYAFMTLKAGLNGDEALKAISDLRALRKERA